MALGFYEDMPNGHRIIGHAGDTEYFHSDLYLVPDANVGFFISHNSDGKGEISARTAVGHKFLDRYFPYASAHPPARTLGPFRAAISTIAGAKSLCSIFCRPSSRQKWWPMLTAPLV
jgi:hypothetical protein